MPENVRRYADGETGFFGVMMKALTDGVTVHPASERRDEEGGLSRIGKLGPARFDVDFDGCSSSSGLEGGKLVFWMPFARSNCLSQTSLILGGTISGSVIPSLATCSGVGVPSSSSPKFLAVRSLSKIPLPCRKDSCTLAL